MIAHYKAKMYTLISAWFDSSLSHFNCILSKKDQQNYNLTFCMATIIVKCQNTRKWTTCTSEYNSHKWLIISSAVMFDAHRFHQFVGMLLLKCSLVVLRCSGVNLVVGFNGQNDMQMKYLPKFTDISALNIHSAFPKAIV